MDPQRRIFQSIVPVSSKRMETPSLKVAGNSFSGLIQTQLPTRHYLRACYSYAKAAYPYDGTNEHIVLVTGMKEGIWRWN